MMIMDPHKSVMAIMRKRNEGKEPASAKGKLLHDTDGEMDPRHMAAEDVMHAFHSKDVGHLKQALANFHDLHEMHKDSGRPDEGPRMDMESDMPEL